MSRAGKSADARRVPGKGESRAPGDVWGVACATGHLSLAGQEPALDACPKELQELAGDEQPAWCDAATWAARVPVRSLSLAKNQLHTIDASIAHFRALQRLDVHANQLTSVPVLALPHLTTLNLSHNALSRMPDVSHMPALTSLDLSHNAISDVGRWPSVQALDLSHNNIPTKALKALPCIKHLNLRHNALQDAVPLDALPTELEELSVAENDLPERIFAAGGSGALPRLRVLDVRATQVASLAPLESVFGSAPSLSLSEAKDKSRAPLSAPPSDACVPHQLVRVSNVPSDKGDALTVTTQHGTMPVLYILSDVQGRPESHRRRRGGRGRGGDNDRHRARDEQDDAPQPNAGSALANAKLSTKKKEALGQVPCKFFRNNGCSAGAACPFAHTLPGEGQPKAVCQWYVKGSCRFGHRCALAHILPGQPMSMDRKNKRSAQQSTQPKTERQPDEKGDAPPDAFAAEHAPLMGDEFDVPKEREASSMPHGWGGRMQSALAHTYDAPSAAFGTSPFSHPGTHSLFFSSNPDRAAWTKGDDPLTESSHAEDFLPSSLSDLLTPTELERRTRSARDASSSTSSVLGPDLFSQSMPVSSHRVGGLDASSPPASASASASSYLGPVPPYGAASSRTSLMNLPVPPRRPGTHSLHASPFMPPLLDHTLGTPPSLSPPGPGPVGMPIASRTTTSADDMHRRAMPTTAHSAFFPGRGALPISPAIHPVSEEEEADDAIFELE